MLPGKLGPLRIDAVAVGSVAGEAGARLGLTRGRVARGVYQEG